MKAFEFIKPRKLEEEIDFISLEDKYKLQIPPIFKLFVQNFKIEDDLNIPKYIDKEDNEINQLGTNVFEIKEYEIYLERFLNLNEIYQGWKNGGIYEEFKEYGILRIGYLGNVGGGGLCVGVKENNLDEIWNLNWDFPETNKKIANNIFEFFRGLKLSYEFSELCDDENYNKLYKKWNSEYWNLK